MTNETSTQGLDQELTNALEELRTSLQHAADATASIQRIVPRVTQIGTLFDELASVINTGRAQLGSGTATFSRPTLVPTPQPTPAPSLNGVEDPWTQLADTWTPATDGDSAPAQSRPSVSSANLVSFRLEFESKPGPLDLRAVDDAVSEHPSVRDVALIDYDGRKATLKVWIEDSATPETVHAALAEQAATLFGPDNEVTVVALADAA